MINATVRSEVKNLHTPDSIDGLRGLACLIVLVFHAINQNQPWHGELLTGTARIGVWLFFVLSAFLLTHRLLEKTFEKADLIDYFIGRFLRIIPMFILAVLVYYVFGLIGLDNYSEVIKALTFQGYYNHLWAIPIEFSFYFLLPLFLWGGVSIFKYRSNIKTFLLMITLVLILGVIWAPGENPDKILLKQYIPCFLLGMLAALACKFLPKPSKEFSFNLATLALCSIIFFTIISKSGYFSHDIKNSISGKYTFYGFAWAAFTYSIWNNREMIYSKLLCFKPLAYFGLTIYSTYLFHWLWMHYVAILGRVWAIPVSMALSVITGCMGYIFLERPLHAMRGPLSYWLRVKLSLEPSR